MTKNNRVMDFFHLCFTCFMSLNSYAALGVKIFYAFKNLKIIQIYSKLKTFFWCFYLFYKISTLVTYALKCIFDIFNIKLIFLIKRFLFYKISNLKLNFNFNSLFKEVSQILTRTFELHYFNF